MESFNSSNIFDKEELNHLRQIGSMLQGHPDMKTIPGVEMSTGSLGQGFSVACGMAMASKLDNAPWRVYILLGDGEVQEGIVWEAAMSAAIDLVTDKLERQIRKQRTKLQRRSNDSLRFANFEPLTVDENEEKDGEIVKVKRFNIKPMSPEEAMLQMELIEHNFFVYRDADSNNVNVIYKRKDGNYGLLEPDYK